MKALKQPCCRNVILILALLLGLSLVSQTLAEGTQDFQVSQEPGNLSLQADVQTDSARDLIIILSIDTAKDKIKDEQRQFFLETLLYSRVDEPGTVKAYLLGESVGKPEVSLASKTTENINYALTTLAALKGKNLTKLPDEVRKLFDQISKELVKDSNPLDIWIIEQRSPMSAADNSPLMNSMKNLIKSPAPEVNLHFLYLGDGLEEGLETPLKQIIQEQEGPDGGLKRLVSAYKLRNQNWLDNDDIQPLLSMASNRVLRKEIEDFVYDNEKKLWTAEFTMPGGIAREKPMVYIRHPGGYGPIVTQTVSLQEASGQLIPFDLVSNQEVSWILMQSGSDQQLTLTFSFQNDQQGSQDDEEVALFNPEEEVVTDESEGVEEENLENDTQDTELDQPVPYGLVYRKVPSGKRVWLEEGLDQKSWNRETRTVEVYSDANYLPLEAWQASLTADVKTFEPVVAKYDENGQMVWEFELPSLDPGEHVLTARIQQSQDSMEALASEQVTITVTNKSPHTSNEQEKPFPVVLFDDVSVHSREDDTIYDKPLIVDLSDYFIDPDGDPLTFTFSIGEKTTIENELYNARIAENNLLFYPKKESKWKYIELKLIAVDAFNAKSNVLTLSFEPRSLKNMLSSWGMRITEEEPLYKSVGDKIDYELVYRGEEADRDLKQYLNDQKRLKLLSLDEALSAADLILPLGEPEAKNTVKTSFSVKEDEDGKLYLSAKISSDPLIVDGSPSLPFAPKYNGHRPLNDLMPVIQLNIQNQPPKIKLDEPYARFIKGEVDGSRGAYETITLSELTELSLNLEGLFSNDEPNEKLTYSLSVKGLPHKVVFQDDPVKPKNTDENEPEPSGSEHPLIEDGEQASVAEAEEKKEEPSTEPTKNSQGKDGDGLPSEEAIVESTPAPAHIDQAASSELPREAEYSFNQAGNFDIIFHDIGEAEVRLYARDSTYQSDSLVFNVSVNSRRQRVFKTVIGISLGVVFLLSTLLIVRQHLKPSFKGKVAEVRSGFIDQNGRYHTTSISLDTFRKEAIPLSTLLIAARQPLPRSMDINDFSDSMVQLKGRNDYVVTFGKRARDVLSNKDVKITEDLRDSVVLKCRNGYILEIRIKLLVDSTQFL